MKIIVLLLLLNASFSLCQQLWVPEYFGSTRSTHPLGVFLSRMEHNFQVSATRSPSFSFSVSSGNVWLPEVNAIRPIRAQDQDHFSSMWWHHRENSFDPKQHNHTRSSFRADGVIRNYQFKFAVPVTNQSELKIGLRAFSLDGGKFPFSGLTNDEFIEWFHSNIAGGEDPFARKQSTLNSAGIHYRDEKGSQMTIENSEFVLAGLDASFYRFLESPFLKRHGINANVASQFGLNLDKRHPGLDISIGGSAVKQFRVNRKNRFVIGLAADILNHNPSLGGDAVDFGFRRFLYSVESMYNFVRPISRTKFISIGVNHFLEGPLRNPKSFGPTILTGKRETSHWHYAFSHMYRVLSANSLIFTYNTSRFSFSIYLREDFLVDNAPDAQVGMGLKWKIQ